MVDGLNEIENLTQINTEFFERYSKIDPTEEFMAFMLKPLRQSFRVNLLKGKPEEVVRNLSLEFDLERIPWCSEGYFVYERDKRITKTIEHQLGLIFSQEASSMIPPIALEVEPGMLVLDMAASPGAKTTQIASYMGNEGCIVANDVKYSRLNILISNLQKCGVINAVVTMMDGRSFGKHENKFDRVLLDAPCSNVGMIRKNFKYLKIWNMREVEALSRLQKQLIRAAYKALKPDGILVYSTCTLDVRENEEVVDSLLSTTDAEVEEIRLPVKARGGIAEFEGVKFNREVRKCLRIHPQDNDTEGFFVAKISKPG
ncbi:MAG: NOL1/NOP2/sun family putative RNA methylase [Archaeoglobus sp.]|nr:NOL1/NOP2/sun family putative RNA methylase [Archaeoglobus sp.]